MSNEIKIATAKRLAKLYDCQAVVILAVERNGDIRRVTYGEDKFKCRVIGEWAEGLERYAYSRAPFQTAFGWGNGGVPKPLTSAELESLMPVGRDYAIRNTAEAA